MTSVLQRFDVHKFRCTGCGDLHVDMPREAESIVRNMPGALRKMRARPASPQQLGCDCTKKAVAP